MRRCWRLIIATVLAHLAISSSVAAAGRYQIGTCTNGYSNHAWTLHMVGEAYVTSSGSCGQVAVAGPSAELANIAVADRLKAGFVPMGVGAAWEIRAPGGAVITEIVGRDDLFKDTNNDWESFVKDQSGAILAGQTCTVDPAIGYCEQSGLFQASGLKTDSITLGIACVGAAFNNCPDGSTLHEVRAELDEAIVTIDDPIAPTGITGVVPSGQQHGTVAVFGSASDSTAGLLSLSVVNSANEVIAGPIAVPGTCDYSFVTPCPTTAEGVAIPVDTAKLSNGQNEIRIEATNAAHDEAFSAPYALLVENIAPSETTGTSSGSGQTSTNGNVVSVSQGLASTNASGTGSAVGNALSNALSIALVTPRLTTTATRYVSGELVFNGRISAGATGVITLTVHGSITKRRAWLHRSRASIYGGRFGVRLQLPRALATRTVVAELVYPGDDLYRATKRLLRIKPRLRRRPR